MKITDLDFHLPPEQIAQRPLEERDASRLLLLDRVSGVWDERRFREFSATS
jgi:S-adenosylmethionine:tRNA ribosyltransferase-isomerase